jgi:hypothetical protein
LARGCDWNLSKESCGVFGEVPGTPPSAHRWAGAELFAGASGVASVPEVDTGAFVCAAIAITSREVTRNTTKKTNVSASRMMWPHSVVIRKDRLCRRRISLEKVARDPSGVNLGP